MSSRRRRTSYVAGETFARLPTEVLQSEAFRALPDFAARVLVAIAAQYHGKGNGDMSLTKPEALAYGVAPPWKLAAGVQLLVMTGLIERTRVGRIQDGKGISSLYSLGWVQTDASSKYDAPLVVAQPAPNRWAKWQKPTDWLDFVERARRTAQGKKIAQSPRVYQAGQPGVSERAAFQSPRVTQERRFAGQPGVSPSEISAGGSAERRIRGDGRRDVDRAVGRLITLQPHLPDGDVARSCRTDVMHVARVREKLNRGWSP
jgi:hypothetical protein